MNFEGHIISTSLYSDWGEGFFPGIRIAMALVEVTLANLVNRFISFINLYFKIFELNMFEMCSSSKDKTYTVDINVCWLKFFFFF